MFYFFILQQAVVFSNCLAPSFSYGLNGKISENGSFQSSWNRNGNWSEKTTIIRKDFIRMTENVSQIGQNERKYKDGAKTEVNFESLHKASLEKTTFSTLFLGNVVNEYEKKINKLKNAEESSTKTLQKSSTNDVKYDISTNITKISENDKEYVIPKTVIGTDEYKKQYSAVRKTFTRDREYNIQYLPYVLGRHTYDMEYDGKHIYNKENIALPDLDTRFIAERRASEIKFSINGTKKEIDESYMNIERNKFNNPFIVIGFNGYNKSYNDPKIVKGTDEYIKQNPAIREADTGVREYNVQYHLPHAVGRDEYDMRESGKNIYIIKNGIDKSSMNIKRDNLKNLELKSRILDPNEYDIEYVNPKTDIGTDTYNIQYSVIRATNTGAKEYNLQYALPNYVGSEYDIIYEGKNGNIDVRGETTRHFIPTRTISYTDFSNIWGQIGTNLFGHDNFNITKNVNKIDVLPVYRYKYYSPNYIFIKGAESLPRKSKQYMTYEELNKLKNMGGMDKLLLEVYKNYFQNYSFKNLDNVTRKPNIEHENINTPGLETILSKISDVPEYTLNVKSVTLPDKTIKDLEHKKLYNSQNINDWIIDDDRIPKLRQGYYILKENPSKIKIVRKFESGRTYDTSINQFDNLSELPTITRNKLFYPERLSKRQPFVDIQPTNTNFEKINYLDQLNEYVRMPNTGYMPGKKFFPLYFLNKNFKIEPIQYMEVLQINNNIKDNDAINTKPLVRRNYFVPSSFLDRTTKTTTAKLPVNFETKMRDVLKIIKDGNNPRNEKHFDPYYTQDKLASLRKAERKRRDLLTEAEEAEKVNYLTILERESQIINILKKQTQLLEQVARVLDTKETMRSKTDFDNLLLDLENKKRSQPTDSNKTLQDIAVESVHKKIYHTHTTQNDILKMTVTKKDTALKHKLSTVQTIIDETEIRKALRDDPFVQRILKMAKRKRDQYMKEAKSYISSNVVT